VVWPRAENALCAFIHDRQYRLSTEDAIQPTAVGACEANAARRAACRGPALRHFVYSIRVVGCFNYSCARIPLGDSAVHKIDRSANFAGHRYAGLILLIAKLPVLDFE